MQNLEQPFYSTKRAGKLYKLDVQAKQVLICHIERFLYNNLAFFGTLLKSGTKLC